MADYKKYKVGITVKEPWADDISYEVLDMTLYAVENGGDGCSYVALKDNEGVTPGTDATVWLKATQAGQSIYDLAVKYGHFVGTEEEFEAQYQQVLQDARDAATATNATNAEVTAAEALRVTAEQGRVSAESGRVSAEATRVSNEEGRVSAESGRVSAESSRVSAEEGRVSAESGRVSAEEGRVSAEALRESAESVRVAEWGGMKTDVTTAIGQADTATARAIAAAENVEADHAQYVSDHSQASNDHTRAESDHSTASDDHTTAVSDHGTAGDDHTVATGDHSVATSDHGTAGDDHTLAGTDHSTAVSDHGIAAEDHTQAGTDHSTASTDHTNAAADHTQAGTDHTTAQGDHSTAQTDHTTAAGDHTQAGTDHTTAQGDHTLAASDHSTAASDHTTAGTDHTTAQGDHTQAGEDHAQYLIDHESIAEKVDKSYVDENFAKQDGYYEKMGVGIAKNLEGRTVETDAFFARTTGGEADISNGTGQLQEVNGNSVKYNQLVDTNTTSVPTISGRKYYKKISGDSSIVTGDGNAISVTGGVDMVIDLTAIGIDSLTTVTDVEDWIAANWGIFDYYPYNPGSVVNVNMTGLESTGQNLLNPTTGKAEILGAYSEVYGNYYGIVGTHGTLTFVDSQGNESTITPDSDGKFLLETPGVLSVATPGADCSVFHWWDGSKTDYTEYGNDVANLDVTHIYGKKNGAGDLVRVWPTGMPGLGDLKDMLTVEGGEVVARRKMGEADMGTLELDYWNGIFFTHKTDKRTAPAAGSSSTLLSSKYITVTVGNSANGSSGNIWEESNSDVIYIKDSAYTDVPTFKTAVTGQKLYYELATEEVYTDLVYQGSSIFADGTPVVLPVNYNVDNWGDETVLPRNSSAGILTAKPTITSRYSIDAVETLDTHGTEIENLHEQDATLDAKKPNKAGEYPEFIAGAAKTLVGDKSTPAEYVFRPYPGGNGLARLDRIKGKSLVWNQLCKYGDFSSTTGWSAENCTVTVANNEATIVNTGANGGLYKRSDINFVAGHKYYIGCNAKSSDLTENYIMLFDGDSTYLTLTDITSSYKRYGFIKTISNNKPNGQIQLFRTVNDQQGGTMVYKNVVLIDLTLMFGAGNEPSTVEEFEALYPLPYYAYNAGEIVNNGATAIETVGFNQWDEEWEEGRYDTTTGEDIAASGVHRSKHMLPVLPNTDYYAIIYVGTGTALWTFFYDAGNNLITGLQNIGRTNSVNAHDVNGYVFTTPSNCRYVKFYLKDDSSACINLSDPSRNGTYEPYKKVTLPLNIPTLTGKLNGEGESVTLCANGAKSAGSVYDEFVVENGYITKFVKRIGVVDLGTLTPTHNSSTSPIFIYNGNLFSNIRVDVDRNILCSKYPISDERSSSNVPDKSIANNAWDSLSPEAEIIIKDSSYSNSDAATFKAAMSGVMLYYELAEPEVYILDTPVTVTYEEESGSTERRLPDDTASAVNAALALDITYPMDAVKQLNDMPKDYTNVGTLDSLLSTLGTALNGTITKTWDATNQKYTFTFTPNA